MNTVTLVAIIILVLLQLKNSWLLIRDKKEIEQLKRRVEEMEKQLQEGEGM